MSHLIIVGASTRAAAMSALRAGWSPWCADLFADADLEGIAPVRKIAGEQYPEGLIDALEAAPPGPWMYTGALENRPDLIARVDRPLLGNPADVVLAIRSPEKWTACLAASGLPCPAMANCSTVGRTFLSVRSAAGAMDGQKCPSYGNLNCPKPGRWLLKPRRSAGGFGIRDFTGQEFDSRTHYLQEYVDGIACSAVFHAANEDARLLGVTEQLTGTPWLNARHFHYAGSIGPLDVDPAPWRAIGTALTRKFHLCGLFGVDAVLRDDVIWPVEINPRYTASVEVMERPHATPQAAKWGKAILFARDTLTFPNNGPWIESLRSPFDLAEYADIPHAGDVVERGRPLLTIFASGVTVEECRQALQEKAQALDRRLWG